MITSVDSLLRTLNSNKNVLESLFEKRNRIVYIHELLNDDLSFEKLKFLEETELIDINDDMVELSDKVIDFFEEFLDTSSGDISIGDIDEILENLSHFIGLYYNENKHLKKQEYLKKIRRSLKKIPNMILKNLKQLSIHVELTYKTQTNFKNKIKELEFYNAKLKKLLQIEQKINKTLQIEQSFFDSLYDMEIVLLEQELRLKLKDLRISLIELQKSVTSYLNKILQQVSFWQHLIKLKELSDNYEIKDKTNILELLENKVPLIFSEQTLNVKALLEQDIVYEKVFEDRALKLLKNKKLKPAKQVYSPKISKEYFDKSKLQKYVINTDILNKEFLQTNYNLFEFIEFKKFEINMEFEKRVELYCKMLLEYESDYSFKEEYKISNGIKYLLVYPKEIVK